MADIRIKDLPTTASQTSSGDFIAIDGLSSGTRKLSATAPAFLTSVTTPSLTSPASTNLTLGLGTGGTALTLASSTLAATFAGAVTVGGTASINGGILLADTKLVVRAVTDGNVHFRNAAAFSAYAGAGLDFFNNAGDTLTDATFRASAYNFSSNGIVRVLSSTAGSSGAGALVVQGGISVSNTGVASYFGGNVGIGTAGPVTALQVVGIIKTGSVEIQSIALSNSIIGDNIYYDSGFKYRATAAGSLAYFESGDFEIRTAPSGSAGAAATLTQVLTVKQNGNLLIGTTTDAGQKLQVNGAATFAGAVTANSGAFNGQTAPASGASTEIIYGSNTGTMQAYDRTNSAYKTMAIAGSSVVLQPNGTAQLTATTTGTTIAGAVTVAGTVIHTLSATPASASATGTVGTMSWDASYIYICTATNTWKRVAIATW